MNHKTAIVLGGTGLTGNLLLKRLMADDSYTTIKLFSRRASGIRSEKLEEFIGDLLWLEQFKNDFTGDEVFCCVGTTSAKSKDRVVYKAIDFGIPYAAAKLARENNIPTYLVISSMGANTRSRIFYSRTKGEMEQAVLGEKIPHTYILRPSLILGKRADNRISERMGAAMIQLAKSLPPSGIIISDKLQDLGRDH
ncbi:NAD-dependent epimerase/dehydratase family protein [Bacteroidota bacterium]